MTGCLRFWPLLLLGAWSCVRGGFDARSSDGRSSDSRAADSISGHEGGAEGGTPDSAVDGAGPIPVGCAGGTVVFADSFDRVNSASVGNGWVETEDAGGEWRIDGSALQLVSSDAIFRPVAQHAFPAQASGRLALCYAMDFKKVSVEDEYAVFVQLGTGAQMVDPVVDHAAGAVVTLKWAGPSTVQTMGGMPGDEGFGWELNGTTTQLAVLSGPSPISVTLDLDGDSAVITAGGKTSPPIKLPTGATVDTIRIMANELNDTRFSGLTFDAIEIVR